ncbi:molecular chaperone HtpG [Microvirga lotononidis]|uniref:Chaperone protein HtpG n=1 Tax=Microvirga lotononidis TaxID=864069 RepID=I4Z2A0_9HYPH|nr:molecular chaperone HtpG [Microvirga lotononidis]EIM30342.1 molecular chaperone of HSP90 family [Microvirga lotononidis]WQO30844.1 molecular chaperone HtpG [Microvirga lotononidis]
MTTADAPPAPESHTFEADVAKLLHLMVHSVYSDKDVFLRELISNAADACEKLRYEAIANPALLGDDPKPRITLLTDTENRRLTIQDNGIGMSRDEMIEALGTIARSGTKAFMERIQAAQGGEGAQLIGQFGVGFYSAFMVADRVDVVSRRAGSDEATIWSSDGKGSYTVAPIALDEAPARGTRVVLHLLEDAASYTERYRLERIVKEQSGHVPVPIAIIEKPGAEPQEVADGAALWAKPRSEITPEDYTDFYRSVAGQFDEPALTVHFRAEGRHEYTALAFVPGSTPFDLFDPDRHGRMKLYVKRVFITDEAEILPRYLRFVRGLVDSADLPLNVSREMIQESPLLAAIKKGVTSRILSELEKLVQNDAEAYTKVWEAFGPVLKEGLYEDFERRSTLLGLARFKTTASGGGWRSLKDYVGSLKESQTAIYYVTGTDLARLEASPQLEGFRARGIEVLLLPDAVDSFWVTAGIDYEGKPLKSVTQGAADLALIPLTEAKQELDTNATEAVARFIQSVKETLGASVADVRASERLTESAVCLVASETGMDRQLERLLARAGQLGSAAKPVLEINPRHDLVLALANLGDAEQPLREDAAHLLLDEARILDGELPGDAKAFSQRLTRVMRRGMP